MRHRLDPRLAAALAVVLVGGVLLGILTLGRLHYPDFPTMSAARDPAVPGRIAWTTWEESSDVADACVWVAPASGSRPPRRVRCGAQLHGPAMEWRDGLLVLAEHPTGARLLNPDTGEYEDRVVSGATTDPEGPRTWAGITALVKTPEPGRVELWLDDANHQWRVASVEGPRDYNWWDVAWSPEGRWVAVQDSVARILIVDTRTGVVRLLAEDAGTPVWGP